MPSAAQSRPARIAADVGGTFTDVAVFDSGTGRLALGKTLTTTDRIVDGIGAGVGKAGARFGVELALPPRHDGRDQRHARAQRARARRS